MASIGSARRAARVSGMACVLFLLEAAAWAGEPQAASGAPGAGPSATATTSGPPAPSASAAAVSARPSAPSPPAFGPPKAPSKNAKPARSDASVEVGGRRPALGSRTDEGWMGAESAELRVLRAAEEELFPRPAASPANDSWARLDVLPPPQPAEEAPRVLATGVPPGWPPAPAGPPRARPPTALDWLERLEMPDLPVRWDERVVRYLQFFRSDPRGRSTFASLFRRSGRWREMMRRTLRRKGLPEDLVWVSMIESGFDATIHSAAGAAGLWQFMPETAHLYGLATDHWIDQRLDPWASTEAAARFLDDLHRRYGSWELVLAAFNMGHPGLSSVVRRYNTNDFWSLARTEGTLPWETTLYVPKVLAAAVVARNLAAFGFADVPVDPPVETEDVAVPPGTPLSLVAQAAGCSTKDLEALNPELRAGRTPPADRGDAVYTMRVAPGRAAAVAQGLARLRRDQPPLDRYIVRFGETLEQIAAAHKTTAPRLVELNAISPGEALRGGTVLLVPHAVGSSVEAARPAAAPPATPGAPGALGASAPRPVVVVPQDVFVYPDRRRVFYRVVAGDTLKEIAGALHVPADDLCRWNDVDPSARLQEGMTLQAFVPEAADLSGVAVASEADVQVLAVGSEEFFAALEHDKSFRRVTVRAKTGETIEAIGRRFDVGARTMERINRRNRGERLKDGEMVVVYVPAHMADRGDLKSRSSAAETVVSESTPNGPLPAPPVPDLLP